MNSFGSDNKLVVSKNSIGPENPKDSQNLWQRLIDGFRQSIGFKPAFLAERWTEARIRQENAKALLDETEAAVKLLEAKANYELKMAQARALQSLGPSSIDGKTADPVIQKLANPELRSPEETLDELNAVIKKITEAGGSIEIVEDEE